MRGETLHFEAQVRVAGIRWPRPGRRSGLLSASVECGMCGAEAFVMRSAPAGLRR